MPLADRFALAAGVLLSLSVLSRLAGENRFARGAESLFVGVSAGYVMAVAAWSTLVPNLIGRIHPPLVAALYPSVPPAEPDRTFLVPLLLGLFLLPPRGSRFAGLARWTAAFVVGFAAGAGAVAHVAADLLGPIRTAWVPLVALGPEGRVAAGETAGRVALVFGTLAGYAALSPWSERFAATRLAARAGRVVILVALGAGFGGILVSRAAQLAGRLDDLASEIARVF